MKRLYPGDLVCPLCGDSQSRVTNTSGNKAGDCITRRRECFGCHGRFNTHERVPDRELADLVERLRAEVEQLRDLVVRRHVSCD